VHEIDEKAFVFTSTIKEAAGGVLKRRARDHWCPGLIQKTIIFL